MALSIKIAALALLSGIASATIAPNSPMDGTVCIGGNVCTVSWVEDNAQPLASAFGPTAVGLFVGNIDEQTQVQDLGQVQDPSDTAQMSMEVGIDPNAGPDGSFYFIRFQSLSATDDAGTPLQAFSAMFTLASMTGTLSDEAQAQVDDTSSSDSITSSTALDTTTSSVAESSESLEAESTSGSKPRISDNADSASERQKYAESTSSVDNPFLDSSAPSAKVAVSALFGTVSLIAGYLFA